MLKRVAYLDLTLETRADGRFCVVRAGEVLHSSTSETIALAYLELAEEAILREEPSLAAKDPRRILREERAFSEILSARGEARARARSKAQQKGGRGGRGGV